MNEQNHATYTV